MTCRQRLEAYLQENGVRFEIMTHPETYTMQEVAHALHVPGAQVAKVVMVKADGDIVMLVVPAPYRLDLKEVKGLVGAKRVTLADEDEFEDIFADCEIGAMPPFGNLYDLPVYVERALANQREMIFKAGTHREVMKIDYADFAALVKPTEGTFAVKA